MLPFDAEFRGKFSALISKLSIFIEQKPFFWSYHVETNRIIPLLFWYFMIYAGLTGLNLFPTATLSLLGIPRKWFHFILFRASLLSMIGDSGGVCLKYKFMRIKNSKFDYLFKKIGRRFWWSHSRCWWRFWAIRGF